MERSTHGTQRIYVESSTAITTISTLDQIWTMLSTSRHADRSMGSTSTSSSSTTTTTPSSIPSATIPSTITAYYYPARHGPSSPTLFHFKLFFSTPVPAIIQVAPSTTTATFVLFINASSTKATSFLPSTIPTSFYFSLSSSSATISFSSSSSTTNIGFQGMAYLFGHQVAFVLNLASWYYWWSVIFPFRLSL